jgi:hypothetical protein
MMLLAVYPLAASERDALAISAEIRQRHMPYGTILAPVYAAPSSNQIVSYSRCGDSAIWTGHYLAAEAFRYNVTRSPDALVNVRAALEGLKSLIDITGTNLLARCLVPVSSPYAGAITREEAPHGAHLATLNGVQYHWIGNTSRDQYCGFFFGLGVAFDMVDDPAVRSSAAALATRALDFLISNGWNVRMPNGAISTTFAVRADQQLTLLQIGRRLNPNRFSNTYSLYRFFNAVSTGIPIGAEVLDDHNSYFKFNLDTINLYHLIRLESSSFRTFYDGAYDLLRRTTDDHGNAHFNLIDRALRGPDPARDADTRAYLRDWLLRPRRDFPVDLRGRYEACGPDRACQPIPVLERVRTDFLWQRSPFLLFGGGDGFIEAAGIDYILPYWMGRHYGVISAEPQPPVALAVAPASGSGATVSFRFDAWDPNGHEDVRLSLIVANRVLAANASCYLYYDRTSRSVWLANDAASVWIGPAALGSTTRLQNSQCALDASRSSDTGTGETFFLNLALSFPLAGGAKNIYYYTQDAAGQGSGWQQLGAWNTQ